MKKLIDMHKLVLNQETEGTKGGLAYHIKGTWNIDSQVSQTLETVQALKWLSTQALEEDCFKFKSLLLCSLAGDIGQLTF